jgi:hypothetical protein
MILKVKLRGISRVAAAAVLALGLSMGSLAACSSHGAKASCESSSSCTVTFDRNTSNAKVSVLGQTVELINSDNQSVTLSVNGKQVNVAKGSGVNVGKIHVTVDQITSDKVVVKATRS